MTPTDNSLKEQRAELAKIIITALRANGAKPCKRHADARGQKHGQVEAWPAISIRDDALRVYVVASQAMGREEAYGFTDDIHSLGHWLAGEDADPVQFANAYNLPPTGVHKDYSGPCRVILARQFNALITEYQWILDQASQAPAEFPNQDVAHAFVRKAAGNYKLAPREFYRPAYHVVRSGGQEESAFRVP